MAPADDPSQAGSKIETIFGSEAPTAGSVERDVREPARGDSIGRYVVLGRLGAGGMGVVYSVYDPGLDRKVALKVLRGDTPTSERGTRMLREAQALAKLAHPHVVTVHDAGVHDGRIWLAMELVDGITLTTWLTERRPTWSDALAVMLRAGEGLAAAHAVGLVHRDFKPDNVMLGHDGRARVMDFGLARIGDERISEEPEQPSAADSVLGRVVTRAGALLGTPGYMAPEQYLGTPVGAAADQFCFSLVLWEAVFGEKPFGGGSVASLATAVTESPPQEPSRARVPRWLRRAIERGLAKAPADRWPSMDALLAALASGAARQRRSRAAASIAAVAIVILGAVGYRQLDRARRIRGCRDAAATIAAVWPGEHDTARARLHDALVAGAPSFGETAFTKTVPWLDTWAAAWARAREDACVADRIDGSADRTLVTRVEACFAERHDELASLLEVLGEPNPRAAEHATAAASGLSPIEPCIDPDALARRPATKPGRDDGLASVRAGLRHVAALEAAGRVAEADAQARTLLAEAEEVGDAGLLALVRRQAAMAAQDAGRLDDAEQILLDVFAEATATGDDDSATQAAIDLVWIVGNLRARFAEGVVWGRVATAQLERAGRSESLGAANLLINLGSLHSARGAMDEAEPLTERGLALMEQTFGPQHPHVARTLSALAVVHYTQGSLDEAQREYERALAVQEAILGAEHPDVASTVNNLALIHQKRGAFDLAEPLHRRALAIREATLGPDHPDVAVSLQNLGAIDQARQSFDSAEHSYRRALAIYERSLGTEHPHIAATLGNLGSIQRRRGFLDEAATLHLRALAIRERALGPDHQDVASSLHNLASVRIAQRSFDEAERLLDRARTIWETALGTDHPRVAQSLVLSGKIALERGDAAAALPIFTRVLAIRERAEVPTAQLAAAQLLVAEAVWRIGSDRPRAVALARQAAVLQTGSEPDPEDGSAVAWLAAHTTP